MLNYRTKTPIRLISLILAQVFLLTGLVYPESNNKDVSSLYIQAKDLRVPMMGAQEGQDRFREAADEIATKKDSMNRREFLGLLKPKDSAKEVSAVETQVSLPEDNVQPQTISRRNVVKSIGTVALWTLFLQKLGLAKETKKTPIVSKNTSKDSVLGVEGVRKVQREARLALSHKGASERIKALMNSLSPKEWEDLKLIAKIIEQDVYVLIALGLAETDGLAFELDKNGNRKTIISTASGAGFLQPTKDNIRLVKNQIQALIKKLAEEGKLYDVDSYAYGNVQRLRKFIGEPEAFVRESDEATWKRCASDPIYSAAVGAISWFMNFKLFYREKVVSAKTHAGWEFVPRHKGEAPGYAVLELTVAAHNGGPNDPKRAVRTHGPKRWLEGIRESHAEIVKHNYRFNVYLRVLRLMEPVPSSLASLNKEKTNTTGKIIAAASGGIFFNAEQEQHITANLTKKELATSAEDRSPELKTKIARLALASHLQKTFNNKGIFSKDGLQSYTLIAQFNKRYKDSVEVYLQRDNDKAVSRDSVYVFSAEDANFAIFLDAVRFGLQRPVFLADQGLGTQLHQILNQGLPLGFQVNARVVNEESRKGLCNMCVVKNHEVFTRDGLRVVDQDPKQGEILLEAVIGRTLIARMSVSAGFGNFQIYSKLPDETPKRGVQALLEVLEYAQPPLVWPLRNQDEQHFSGYLEVLKSRHPEILNENITFINYRTGEETVSFGEFLGMLKNPKLIDMFIDTAEMQGYVEELKEMDLSALFGEVQKWIPEIRALDPQRPKESLAKFVTKLSSPAGLKNYIMATYALGAVVTAEREALIVAIIHRWDLQDMAQSFGLSFIKTRDVRVSVPLVEQMQDAREISNQL